MYPCLLLKVLAEYDLQLCACRKRDSCVPVFLYALRGDTRPGYISRGGERRYVFITVSFPTLDWVLTLATLAKGTIVAALLPVRFYNYLPLPRTQGLRLTSHYDLLFVLTY